MIKRILTALALAMACGCAWAQAPDTAWPRELKAADGTAITVYQPQLERWTDNNLSGRAAVSVMRPDAKDPRYGVIELSARTQVDKSIDVATLSAVRITKSSFPGATEAQSEQYLATLRTALPKDGWPVSVQALQANLAIAQAQSRQKTVPVKNDPPQILFRTTPSLLVLIDGEPALREVKEAAGVMRVINTSALVLLDNSYYLWAFGRWWTAKEMTGEWQQTLSVPPRVDNARKALEKQFDPLEGKTADGKPAFDPGVVPQIVLATKPTELLQSKGEPKFSPIPGTQLLYMSNSSNDIFLELGAQSYYVLISGRWFSAKALAGPWSFVLPTSLPGDFAKIPPGHSVADVLMSVPGTTQAREAAIANQIPQTATVQRDVQPAPVAYDGGAPQWKPIDGTPLAYAYNTGAPVIQVDMKTYYMVQNGVWFSATAPAGPWVVAASVPTVIYTIPPSSPVHYVTYVRVYSSTPTTVFVGYTPGYYGTVMTSSGVVVYGTGYVYPVYVGTVWYPPPPTYGFGVAFATGVFVGYAMSPWHRPCCWGGPVVVHHTSININNSYNRWGGKSTSISGSGGRNVQATQAGQTTLAKGAGSNNVYAGRDGQVYRRESDGQWQKYQGGGGQGGGSWSDVEKPQREKPQQSLPSETRNSLDRQHQSRQTGEHRAQQFRESGGGGFRGGGRRR